MTTTTRPASRSFAPRLWAQARYTIPRVDLAEVDPITRWLVLSRASVIALAVWQTMPGLLLVAGALPLLRWVFRIYNAPKPDEPPEGYRGWPLWFVGVTFVHNRRFGVLFIAGLALQLVGEAAL